MRQSLWDEEGFRVAAVSVLAAGILAWSGDWEGCLGVAQGFTLVAFAGATLRPESEPFVRESGGLKLIQGGLAGERGAQSSSEGKRAA